MARTVLTNADWAQLASLFPKRGPAQHRRKRLEGILWVHRTGGRTLARRRAAGLLEGPAAGQVVADRGYDSDALRETIKAKGGRVGHPRTQDPQGARRVRQTLLRVTSRHVIETFFCRTKDHRRVATRYEKTAAKFAALVTLSCILVWLQR